MKISYIVNARIPTEKAHGFQICKMCEKFGELGNKVELIVPDRKNEIREDAFLFYDVKKKFVIRKIRIIDFLKYQKFFGFLSFYLLSLSFFLKLVFLRLEKDALVYTRTPEIAWLFSLRGFFVVYEMHAIPKTKKKFFYYIIRNVNFFIVTSNGLRNSLIKNGFNSENVAVQQSGVDVEKFDIKTSKESSRKKTGLPLEKIIFGYTGNFKTMGMDKGIVDSLKALKILKDEKYDCFFVAVGGSKNDIEYYKKMAKDVDVFESVLFLERVGIDSLAIHQKAFDLLLMPFPCNDHYSQYMSPIKMFEYMASRRPIVASDLPSVRGVLNEKNCLFCKSDDPVDLAKQIKKIVEKIVDVDSMIDSAFEKVQQYTWKKRADNIIKFIS